MSSTFSRTTRSLMYDGARRRTGKLLIALVLLAVWLAWFAVGQVTVHETTEQARLEVASLARPIVSLVDGQVVESRLELGTEVDAGALLIQLDDRTERLALGECQSRLNDLEQQMQAIHTQIAGEEDAAAAYLRAGESAIAQCQARIQEAAARAEFAEAYARRQRELFQQKVATSQQVEEADSDARARRAGVEVLKAALLKETADQQVNLRDRQSKITHLRRELAERRGERDTQQATLARLNRDVELRQVRAPLAGRIGQVRDFPVGSAVKAGDALGYMIPPSRPHVVASFPVASAGRIQTGQQARLRLDGFSWLQYGRLAATVTEVATEAQDGRLRVEMQLEHDPGIAIPVEHGLPGSAEVLVEHVTPAVLVLRTAGWFLTGLSTDDANGVME